PLCGTVIVVPFSAARARALSYDRQEQDECRQKAAAVRVPAARAVNFASHGSVPVSSFVERRARPASNAARVPHLEPRPGEARRAWRLTMVAGDAASREDCGLRAAGQAGTAAGWPPPPGAP